MLKLVIFDFDGVIADTESAHYEMFRKILEQDGFDLDWRTYCRLYMGYTDIECFEHLMRDLNQDDSPERISALATRKSLAFRDYIQEHSVIFPGVHDLLVNLEKNKIASVICSGALRDEIKLILEQTGIHRFFKQIVAAEDVLRGKPDPQGYVKSLSLVNAGHGGNTPFCCDECVVIEDSSWGIRAAKGAGMRCVAVMTSSPREQLCDADRIVDNMSQVTVELLKEVAGNPPC